MSLLVPGDTCWRIAPADRVAFLIDTEAYFTALYEAFRKARRSILILGWAFDPRTRLSPDAHDGPNDPDEVGHALLDPARARPDLDIRLLIWKSALPIAATQEFFPHKARAWFRDSRVRFHLDDKVPLGACHHQKAVVIDDRLAFCGGGDIGVDRWDTPGHLEHDLRRIMPDQDCHDPRHEVMVMADGAAARTFGDHFRERWRCATGETLSPPPEAGGDPWPDHIPPHVTDTRVGVARTAPPWQDQPDVHEIRDLALASIAAARETIYLENQYFTSPLIAEALANRLGEPEGPEVVLISTGRSPSWFDKLTMDNARANTVWRLRAADVFGRFRAFYPVTAAGSKIIVHSKVSVFDDRLARIGSANLNNRSFGFDTEIEVALEAEDERARRVVAAFRDRLVAHFLGYTGDAVSKARAERGGLIPAIDALNREGRLRPIELTRRSAFGVFTAAYHLGDPASPEDAWRPWRRRDCLYRDALPARVQRRSKSITSGR